MNKIIFATGNKDKMKEKLKMMNGVLENGNYQLGQFAFIKVNI